LQTGVFASGITDLKSDTENGCAIPVNGSQDDFFVALGAVNAGWDLVRTHCYAQRSFAVAAVAFGFGGREPAFIARLAKIICPVPSI
jgi:hypothetical protein